MTRAIIQFDPKLILIHPMVSDKEELLQRMNQVLNAGGYVTEHYIKKCAGPGKTVSTYIGNGVAIPHGFQTYVNESKGGDRRLKRTAGLEQYG